MVQNNLNEHDVLARASELDFPNSVVGFMQGELGQPYGGFPEPLRTQVRQIFLCCGYPPPPPQSKKDESW